MDCPPLTAAASPESKMKSPLDFFPCSTMRTFARTSRNWKRERERHPFERREGPEKRTGLGQGGEQPLAQKTKQDLSNAGEARTRSFRNGRSRASTWVSMVARTVAVRGQSESRAISPKDLPRATAPPPAAPAPQPRPRRRHRACRRELLARTRFRPRPK